MWEIDLPDQYYDEPQEPEPTLEEYCHGQGHLLYATHPDSLIGLCHCGELAELVEPFDEYAALHMDLIEEYIALNVTKGLLVPNPGTEDDMRVIRYNVGKHLRNASIEYLQELIASVKRSYVHPSYLTRHYGMFSPDAVELYVKTGYHIHESRLTSIERILKMKYRGQYIGWKSHYDTRFDVSVLDYEDGVESARTLILLYMPFGIELGGQQRGFEVLQQDSKMEKQFSQLFPHLKGHDDLVSVATAMYKKNGFTDETTARIINLIDSGSCETTPPPMIDGVL